MHTWKVLEPPARCVGGTSKTEAQGLGVGRPGWPGEGPLSMGPFFLSHRFRIYSNQSALESLAVSWEEGVQAQGWGLGRAVKASPSPHCPDFLSPHSQLIPLQTPLKTLLQIAVMPMLNGRVGVGV